MRVNRRDFFKLGAGAGLLATFPSWLSCERASRIKGDKLMEAVSKPVLRAELINSPVMIQSIDLLRNGKNYIIRATSREGATGIAVSNRSHMRYLYPLLLQRVIPYFIGKDARDLETLIDGVFVHNSNYKLQGLAFWLCVASVEFALLDLLGQISGKPVGELLGGVIRMNVPIYIANNHRGKTAEETVELLMQSIDKTGAEALKFKVGGRMSNNADSPPGRTEALIPLARKILGDGITIYADSNGSYDVQKSIEIGGLLEAVNVSFFEEPCPFDQLEETRDIANALSIPIAGGEQESSLRRFRWMIENGALEVVQPDLFYFGGFIRSIRVARMAEVANLPCTIHLSGSGLGYLYMLHFASCVPNIGPHQEYKGRTDRGIPLFCDTASLDCTDGVLQVPSGPGFGVRYEPELWHEAEQISST